jgi:biopolymer transport protein ExbD
MDVRGKRKKSDDIDPDLTPMIDCVFLLLIFFMLITEITQADLEHMQLPEAQVAKPDKPDKERFVINIVKENPNDDSRAGLIKVKGRVYGLGSQNLINLLKHEADPGGRGQHRDERGFSERKLLVRCDRRVHYKYFQELLTLCAKKDLGILVYKIQIAISKESN